MGRKCTIDIGVWMGCAGREKDLQDPSRETEILKKEIFRLCESANVEALRCTYTFLLRLV